MFPNSNKRIIKTLTSRSLKANRSRNRYVILAIVMTAWLLTSVFSIGMSYMKSFSMQDQKFLGTKADVAFVNPAHEQLDKLANLPYVKKVGLDYEVAHLATNENEAYKASFHLYDESEWNNMKAPLLGGKTNGYPQKRNEVLMPKWLLDEMGITEPKVGLKLDLSYLAGNDANGNVRKESFVLSGWYDDYTQMFSDNSGKILVSKSFAEALGAEHRMNGVASIMFKGGTSQDEGISKLEQDLALQEGQDVYAYSRTVEEGSLSTWFGTVGVSLIVMFSGYLLIYNVLYISVSTDTKFYGLLKTIGMTRRQVKKLVNGQARRLMWIGIPIGLLLGAITSYLVVPFALSMFSLETEVEISFHPLIYMGAALFAVVTTMAGSRKPARIASKISAVEASKYVRASSKKSRSGAKLHRMAWRNIFRDKKRATMVFLSLVLGLTTFLTINTLILSMSTDNFIGDYVANDFELINKSAEGYNGEVRQLFTDKLLSSVEQIDGIKQIRTMYMSQAFPEYTPEVFGKHVDEFTTRYGAERPTDEILRQEEYMFSSRLVGIETKYIEELNETLETPIDIERFDNGEIALLDMSQQSLKLGDTFNLKLPNDERMHSFEIGGIAEQPFKLMFGGLAPNIYISEKAMKQLIADPIIYKINMSADKEEHPAIQEQLERLTAGSRDITLESKQQWIEMMESAKLMFYILGGAITLILAFIGIMNFVSTMFTSVVIRRNEFAIMESIGMTSKQLRKLLLFEGLGYAAISSLLVSTLGSLVSYGAYKVFSQEATYAVFEYPLIPLIIILVIVFGVCLTAPIISYNQTRKSSIVDRMKEAS